MKMNSTMPAEAEAKVIPLNVERKAKPTSAAKQRFRVMPFFNPSGAQVWRVTGTTRQGKIIKENFRDENAAHCRQVELMSDYFGRQPEDSALRATKLTPEQLRIAEAAFKRLDDDDEMLVAISYWQKHGKHHEVKESPRLDEALKKFKQWLDGKDCDLREHSKKGLRLRVESFCVKAPNLCIDDVRPEVIEDFLDKLTGMTATTKDNYRRAVSRFFSWCIQRPRRWAQVNPCREIKIARGEKAPPAILSVEDCEKLLREAEKNDLAAYAAVCLFAGLRPTEASRLDWKAVNLKDREIRLEGIQTKTGKPRVVSICDTLHAWLEEYEGESFHPKNWRKKFDKVKAAAGYAGANRQGEDAEKKLKPWTPDVMRHTAISHYFRKSGSYGLTAEQFGNSEAIIKAHYQGRVSSDDAKKFYSIRPKA